MRASIRTRQNRNGLVYQVRWRQDGQEPSCTFTNEDLATIFKGIIESDGPDAAYRWLESRGPASEDNPADVWTLDRVVEHHIAHRTGISAGTRALYRREYMRTWGIVEIDGARLGGKPIELVRREEDIARAINLFAEEPRESNSGKPLSPKTIANAHGLLSSALKTAVRHPDIPLTTNLCEGMRLPSGEDSEDDPAEMVCLSPDEFAILYLALPDYWKPLVLTLYATGMRWGEATALQVKHVDLDGRLISVRRAWKQAANGAVVIGAPKGKSRRVVKISKELVAVLEPLVQGKNPEALVFFSQRSNGGQNNINHSTWLERVWYPIRWRASRCADHLSMPNPCGCVYDKPQRCTKKEHKGKGALPAGCGCEGTLKKTPRIHDLRHSHASWLISKNVNLAVISKRLGHKSISITVDVYGHLMDESQDQAADAMSLALEGLELAA